MPLQENKLALKRALSADLDFGLKWLDAWTLKNSDTYTEILMHRSNLQTVKKDLRKQLVDPDAANRKIAAVRYALMNLVDEVKAQEIDQEFDHTGFLEQLHQLEKEKTPETTAPLHPAYGKWIAGILLISVAGLLLWLGYTNKAAKGNDLNATFDLNMIVYGDSAKSQIIREGTLRVLHRGKPETLPIGPDGRVVWSNLSNASRNTSFQINPQVDDFTEEQFTLQIPEQENVLDVILRPIQHQTEVRGNVQVNGKPGSNLLVDLAGYETRTDQKGDFAQQLPFKRGTEVRIRVFANDQEIYNGMERISSQLIPITIDQ